MLVTEINGNEVVIYVDNNALYNRPSTRNYIYIHNLVYRTQISLVII